MDNKLLDTILASLAVVIFLIGWGYFAEPTNKQTEIAQKWGLEVPFLLKEACKQRNICKKYKDVRFGCAEAGSISKCVEIKMEGEAYGACSDAGISPLAEEVQPSSVQCIFWNLSSMLPKK
jgi:hypothetical protein